MIRHLGIDLGTNNVRICVPNRGIVVNDPSVVAMEVASQKVLAVGDEAKAMIGRTPESIVASNPLVDGVIASYRITKQMLQIYLNRILGRIRILKPEVIVDVPVGATSTEKKAILDAVESIGVRKVYLMKAPVAAALGAGIDISSSTGNMIIDVGGGKTEVAVIALGDIVSFSSVRYGGNKFDDAIVDYIRKKHNLVIGNQSAETIKINIGSAAPLKKDLREEISGSNTITGLPESLIVHTGDIVQAIKPVLNEIILAVKQVLQKTPPELSSDVMDKGIVICGGGSKLRNFDNLMTKVTGVPCQMAEEPELSTIKGMEIALENFQDFTNSLIWRSK